MTLSLAAVEPPGHAVGRRPARRPRGRRHRARHRRRPGRVRRPARRGATDLALWFFSDRTDVWSLYRKRPHEEPELVVDVGSDIAGPQWVFGQSRFALLADGRVAFAYGREGADRLAVLEADGSIRELDLPYGAFRCAARAQGSAVVCVAAGPSSEPVVLRVDVDGGQPRCCARPATWASTPAWFSSAGARRPSRPAGGTG